MMSERPDLSGVAPDVVAYIEALEAALDDAQNDAQAAARTDRLEPSEPPTTAQIISISKLGLAKRTPRHLYYRQRRGGMGVFDLDVDTPDVPGFLVHADESAAIIVITSQARAFRLPVAQIHQGEVRDHGRPVSDAMALRPDEEIAVVFADMGASFAVLVSERGQVRRIAGHYFGPNLRPGTVLYDIKEGGAPAAAGWTTGGDDLFIVTRQGRAIRFAERQVPVRGCLGLRVDPGDSVVGVAGVTETGGVFLLTDEGKGTIRLMSGFAANKSPGAGGKVAIKADVVVGVAPIHMDALANDDIFVISQLGKLIRFQAEDVPPKEGVVQGVNCMNLRADACVALTAAVVPADSAGP